MPIEKKLYEAYTWQAVYENAKDGNIIDDLWEIDKDGIQISTYSDIDRTRVKQFNVYKTVDAKRLLFLSEGNTLRDPDGHSILNPFLVVEMHSGYRLIWRRRRRTRAFGLLAKPFLTIYMAGWQTTIENRNIQSIVYIYHDMQVDFNTENDLVVMSGGKSDVELFSFETPIP